MTGQAFPAAYCLREPNAVCFGCNTALEPDPQHPGRELGDWYVHPEPRSQFGHTSAFMRRHAALLDGAASS